MKKSDVVSKVAGILHEFGILILPEQYEFRLRDLGVDSLTLVELVIEVENRFELKITNQQAADLTTFNSFVDFICTEKNIA